MENNIKVQAETTATPIRSYKDRVFRMIFKEPREFLELYNALNGSGYDNPEDLIVTTLDNAIYMGIKNDVSYLLYDMLTLYEHQSTLNPNMPLRNLLYVADIYSSLTRNDNLHGSKLIKIPRPQFVVFYNGTGKLPERSTLLLSDMYENRHAPIALELETLVLNINLGCNQQLMEQCRTLHDYAVFVQLIRDYSKELPLSTAVDHAITECIEQDVLAEFLHKNRAEVLKMSIYEYDAEKHIQQEREDARADGIQEGHLQTLISLICKKLRKGKGIPQIAEEIEEDIAYVEDICKIAADYAPDYNEKMVFTTVMQNKNA